jgi:hypothetical protein
MQARQGDSYKLPVGWVESGESWIIGELFVAAAIFNAINPNLLATIRIRLIVEEPLEKGVTWSGLARGGHFAHVLSEDLPIRINHYESLAVYDAFEEVRTGGDALR